jgi:cobyrinic acid a,c-diamide synthase
MRLCVSARVVLIAAIASGQGKTSVTAALARWLIRRGERVRIFKVGSDFIDPLMLERACGQPVPVLDLWMVGEAACRRMLTAAAAAADTVLIEGAMGLYDGNPSAADLARVLGVPVLVVLDVSAMAQTAGAVAMGLKEFGPIPLAGVIANRVVSVGHGAMIADSMRNIPLLGSLPRQEESLPERHLGLVLPGEVDALERQLDALADSLQVQEQAWNSIPTMPSSPNTEHAADAAPRTLSGDIVAIARDAAFAFMYPANIECLQSLGASIRWFSPLADEPIPDEATAAILPGGYPELNAEALSRAGRFHSSLRSAYRRNVPILAECGGMMTLTESLIDVEGRSWPMASLIPGNTRMQSRLAGLGLQAWRTSNGILRGHTFHYSILDTTINHIAQTITHPRGTDGERIYRVGSVTASYFHAYFPSCPEAVIDLLRSRETAEASP